MSVHAGAEHNRSTPVTSPPGAGDDTIGSGGYATDVTPAWGEGAPEWVDVLISLVAAGQMWPEGSEKGLAELAVAFDDLSRAALAGQDVSSRATMLDGWSGASADAFREHTDELASGETGLAGMAQAARAYALQQDSFARATQYGKLSINVGYWITVSAAAVGVMASFLTAGATTPLLAAYAQRLRTFLNQVFGSLERAAGAGRGLTAVAPKLAAVQAAQFGGRKLGQGLLARAVTSHMLRELPEEVGEGLLMDGLAQRRQMDLGTRTSWDTRMTAANVLGDATGALLASRVAPAVSKYVSGLPGLRHLDSAAGDAGGPANVLMRYPTKAASAAATNALVSAPAGMISNGVVYGTWQLPTMEGLVGSMAAGAGRVGTISPLSTDVLSALANPSTALARAEFTVRAQDPTPSPSAPTAGSGQGGSAQNTATHGAGGVAPMTTTPPTPAGDAHGTGSTGTPQRSGLTPTPAGAPTASAPTASAQTGSAPTGAPPSTTSSGATQAGATPQGSAQSTASSGTAQAGAASQGAPSGTAPGGTAQAGTAPQGSPPGTASGETGQAGTAPGTSSGGTGQAGAASQGAGTSGQSAAVGAPGGSSAQTSPIGAAAGTPVAGTGAPTPATAAAGPTTPATAAGAPTTPATTAGAPTAPATAGAGPTAPAAAASVPTASGAPNVTGPGVDVEGGGLVPSKEALALALSGAGTPSVPRLEGIGPEAASDIDQALRELARDYPDLTRALGAVSTTDPHGNFVTQPDLVAYAVMDGGERGIHLNPVAMADQVAAGRVEEATGWTVPGGGSVRGVLYHEVGEHIADRIIGDPDARTALNATVSAALGRPYDVTGVHDQETVTAVESRLSTYGATTPRDLIAEAFTEYRASATPRPLARAVGELIDRLHTTRAHRTQDTAPTTRSREEVYARRRGPSDDPEADPDLWALRAMDGRMSESRYRDEDAERQAGKILQRMANTWGRDGTQWLLDTFQARSPYVRDGILWAARQNGLAGPSGEQQSMAQTSRPPGQSGRSGQSGQSGQPQEAAYQAENLYDSQADRRHWKDVMREADHLAHQYTAADRNQDADAFQDAIDNAQAFVRRHGLADASRTPWYKFKGAAEMDDWMAFREREDTSTGIGFISEILLYDFDLEPDDLKGTGAAGQSGTKGYEPPISDHDDFGKVNVERRTKVPLAGLRPQRVEDYDKASQPLSEEHKEAMRKAYGELRKFIDDLGSREIRFGDLLAIINKVNPTGHNRNCPETSLAIDDILRGKPAVAGPLNAAPVPVIRTTMGRRAIEKHLRLSNLKKVAKILQNEGPGSRGVVIGYSGSGIGHVCNVLNVNGHIYYADGQHQRVYVDRHPMEGKYREYDFFQTR